MTRRSRSTKAAANNTNDPSSEIPRGATSRWPHTAVIASVAVGAAASVVAGISFTTQGQGGLDTRGLTHVFASLSGSSVGPRLALWRRPTPRYRRRTQLCDRVIRPL